MRALFALCLLLGWIAPAQATDLTVTVRTSDGTPVVNAVVSVPGDLADAPGPAEMPAMEQRDLQFNPFVLIVREGQEVVFPNRDRVRHHVYSFARGNRFELELYGREEERTVRFEVLGGVPIGCNIHDDMLAFIRVVDTPFAEVTSEEGVAVLSGMDSVPQTLTVWHPFASGRNNLTTVEVDGSQAAIEITLDIADPR